MFDDSEEHEIACILSLNEEKKYTRRNTYPRIALTLELIGDYCFDKLFDTYIGFSANCNGTFIIGQVEFEEDRMAEDASKFFQGGLRNFVYDPKSNAVTEIKPLNESKYGPIAIYCPPTSNNKDGVLIVTSDYCESNCSIEYLIMDTSFKSNDWKICKDKLPPTHKGYGLNILESKLDVQVRSKM